MERRHVTGPSVPSIGLNVSLGDWIAMLEIDRPPANYFDPALIAAIADAATELQARRDCRVIVLCSAGKHFCGGADFASASLQDDRERAAALLYEQSARLFEIELPVVAAVQGVAIGGGLGLACAADFRVASAGTRFQANFSALGFHHGFGLSVTLPRIVGAQKALDLLLSGRRVTGTEALQLGLADRMAQTGAERDAAMELARSLAAAAPLAVRSIKQTQRGPLADEVRQALKRELAEQTRLWRTRDSREGIAASLAHTIPNFTGK
jgi:2-(1,2-epoxy-1,2-dihydrophenyl)acetyl-CoA isomerase